MSPDRCGNDAGEEVVIYLFSHPGTDCLCPSQPIRLSLCVQEKLQPGRRHTGTVRAFFPSLCSHLHSRLILSDYDSWSFAFNHKNTPLSSTLHSLLNTYSLKQATMEKLLMATYC